MLSGSGSLMLGAICYYKNDERLFSKLIMPTVHTLFDAESAHNLAVSVAKHRLLPRSRDRFTTLSVDALGHHLTSPLGLAAGFDKDCKCVKGMNDIGFGFIEVGSVTPKPQEGNQRPRVFRLYAEEAVINRYGFNSDGHDAVLSRLEALRDEKDSDSLVIGVNLGKNKLAVEAVKDYTEGVRKFAHLADYLVVNVSSPNTPGLRGLQSRSEFDRLVSAVMKTRDESPGKKDDKKAIVPVLLKVAPDLSAEDKMGIAEIALKYKVDGLIVSNTTTSRPESLLETELKEEKGGLSGQPLRQLATDTIGDFYKLTKGKILIVGVGGVSSGWDAFEKILAGASLLQLYTSLVYQGPPVVAKVNRELDAILRAEGYSSVTEAVGKAHSTTEKIKANLSEQ